QAKIDERNAGTDAAVGRAGDRHRSVLEGIAADEFESRMKIAADGMGKLGDASARLAEAQKQLEDAIAAANETAADGGPGGAGAAVGGLETALRSILDGLDSAFDRTGLSSRGTFSASAVADLGNKQLDTLVDVTREVASNTKKIARNSSRGGLAFT
ncbi:MAG: hypothetical protein KDB60_11260, partial [Propionibacteriaceae bacterium]|nr:hypothetical protein [Propionibacteriaceae bacterium]